MVARAFSLGAKKTAGQHTWNFAELVHRELIAYAEKVAESQRMLTCGQVVTRVAYHAVGMVDSLPSATKFEELLNQCQAPLPKAVAAPKPKKREMLTRKGMKTVEEPLSSEEEAVSTSSEEEEEERLERRTKKTHDNVSSEEGSQHSSQGGDDEEPSSSDKEVDMPAALEVRKRWDRILKEREKRKAEARGSKRPHKPISHQKKTKDEKRAEQIRIIKEREFEERRLHAEKRKAEEVSEEQRKKAKVDTASRSTVTQVASTTAEVNPSSEKVPPPLPTPTPIHQDIPLPEPTPQKEPEREQEHDQGDEEQMEHQAELPELPIHIEEEQVDETKVEKEVEKEAEKEKEKTEGTKEAAKKDQPREDKGKEKQQEPSSSEEESEAEEEDEFDKGVSIEQAAEWDTITLARDVQKKMRQIIRTTREKERIFDEVTKVTVQQATKIESQEVINSELVRQLKTNQEKVDYLEKKDIERAKELASMQNEVEKHQHKVFEIEAKLNIEFGQWR